MKQGMIRGAAIAAFAAAMTFAGAAGAAPPNIACTPALQGYTTYTTSNGIRYYYQCRNRQWVFLRGCPVGGGPCFYP